MKAVKVTRIPGAVALEGVSYGPFEANGERPFLEVPELLANALKLPRYEEDGAAEQSTSEEATDAEMLAATNHSPGEELARVTGERDQTREALQQAQADLAREQGIRQALEAEVARLTGELERFTAAVQANTEALQQGDFQQTTTIGSTPLPDDFPMRAKLVEGGFDTVEKVRAGLEKAEGAEKSPIENIQGIGSRTAEAIKAALP